MGIKKYGTLVQAKYRGKAVGHESIRQCGTRVHAKYGVRHYWIVVHLVHVMVMIIIFSFLCHFSFGAGPLHETK